MDRSILSDTHPRPQWVNSEKNVLGVEFGDPPGHSATSSILLISHFGNNFALNVLKRLNNSK